MLKFINWYKLYAAALKCYPKNNVRLIYYDQEQRYDLSIFFSDAAIQKSLLGTIIK